ncbi:MAG: hypothetical protein BAA01_14345 [Bacillus thermozeamaize]|uniref:PDZ domain-containing protein n=1 Tax=Bacillus thermozeamaize TaxID=230954 RepID=A0A1Y3PN27_9BACI|nr:MAG: hypothetical protein BAA01_14345 [Bacillus thermozeamaize]
MNLLSQLLFLLFQSLGEWLLTPFFYVTVLLIGWRNIQLVREEREMLHLRLHAPFVRTARQLLEGVLISFLISAVLLAIGVVFSAQGFALLWGAALLLFLVRRRLQPVYGAFALFWLAGVLLPMGPWKESQIWWIDAFQETHWPSWLVLLGLLQLAEAWMFRRDVRRHAFPLIFQGRRGLPIGGYRMEGWWPLPLLVWGPAMDGGLSFSNAGWPFFAWADVTLTMIPLPLYIGAGVASKALFPAQQASWWVQRRLAGGLLALILAVAGQVLPGFAGIGVFLFLLWESGVWAAHYWRERNADPLFVPDKRGLKVLAVLPESAAEALGIQPGEVVTRVNGQPVHSASQLYHAVQANPAFCKLEVLDRHGEVRFLQRALYEGEHHQLGIIPVPSDRRNRSS